jgi:hypothetical protein
MEVLTGLPFDARLLYGDAHIDERHVETFNNQFSHGLGHLQSFAKGRFRVDW